MVLMKIGLLQLPNQNSRVLVFPQSRVHFSIWRSKHIPEPRGGGVVRKATVSLTDAWRNRIRNESRRVTDWGSGEERGVSTFWENPRKCWERLENTYSLLFMTPRSQP